MPAKTSSLPYTSLPSHRDFYPQNVIVLSYYHPRNHFINRCLLFTTAFFLLSATVYFLYPSDPAIQLSRIRLNHIRVKSSPELTLDVSFSLAIKVRNRDFFSLDYDSLGVSVGYRGRELGFVNSKGGKIRARRSSYVNATLDLNGLEVIHDVFYLIQDLARGVIPFDTETQVKGDLGLLFFKIPIKGRVSCQVFVNTNNQTIEHQDCYPENMLIITAASHIGENGYLLSECYEKQIKMVYCA
ncbi:unnamed protein product [Dovyalis caffra]|uniref:Late embryogenesis abundant protein LEA-2 subgroup domain-containing protein n=1 Tax=Dovyalis caffra TaxID=77055 RepID=A0AAV1REX8_9ROSI|nr:unnamed protein product [Dovyalis caffra]